MSSRILCLSLLGLWTISVVSGPAFLFSLVEDPVTLCLCTGEEEPGNSLSLDELEEKLLVHDCLRCLVENTSSSNSPQLALEVVAFEISHEIYLPPPEGRATSFF